MARGYRFNGATYRSARSRMLRAVLEARYLFIHAEPGTLEHIEAGRHYDHLLRLGRAINRRRIRERGR